MLEQPAIRELPTKDRPQTWAVLATERRKEFHASIFALADSGKPTSEPTHYRTFGSVGAAREFLSDRNNALVLDHGKYTYTVFRFA